MHNKHTIIGIVVLIGALFLVTDIGFTQDDKGGKCGSLKSCQVVNGAETGVCFTNEFCMSGVTPIDLNNWRGTCVIPNGLPQGCIPPQAYGAPSPVRGSKQRTTTNDGSACLSREQVIADAKKRCKTAREAEEAWASYQSSHPDCPCV